MPSFKNFPVNLGINRGKRAIATKKKVGGGGGGKEQKPGGPHFFQKDETRGGGILNHRKKIPHVNFLGWGWLGVGWVLGTWGSGKFGLSQGFLFVGVFSFFFGWGVLENFIFKKKLWKEKREKAPLRKVTHTGAATIPKGDGTAAQKIAPSYLGWLKNLSEKSGGGKKPAIDEFQKE